MEQALADKPWFCGQEITAADVQMSYVLEAAEARTELEQDYPRLAAYLQRVRARPAYKRALDRGGHYDLKSFD